MIMVHKHINFFMSFSLSIIIIFCSFFVSTQAAEVSLSRDINGWCQTTPHPGHCMHYLTGDKHRVLARKKDFRILALEAALGQSHYTQQCAINLDKTGRSKRKKSVSKDCCKLVNTTIVQLNETLTGLKTRKISDFVAQTWLSSALTNLQVCFSGSSELNLTDFVSPIKTSNLTEMISNTLAINDQFFLKNTQVSDHNEEFPIWVTKKDRKLMVSESVYSKANVTVSQAKGSRFRTIQSALDYAASINRGDGRFIIYIKRGVYRENVEIGYDLKNIMFLGDGLRYTIITGNRSVAGGFTTYSTATVGVDGTGFIARGITFRNTAGPEKAQAVALRSASDLSVFYACSFEGYQDTLFALSQRQFYKLCYVYGTIDFIFGNAAVVFQNCMILARRPLTGQANMITAQGRGDPFQNTGISIHNSRVMAAPDLKPVVGSVRTYLGRPWQEYSRTVYMKTYIDTHVSPQGWSPWGNTDFAFNTLYFGEYGCFGPGSAIQNRVTWPGYHVIKSPSEALPFTVERLITGRAWLRATGVPFIAGL
ncbi:putative pectinesterase [Helianthus annuus]|uniref:Pectinesterase n=2 Tax=Helianthus annuus TaxID=4232 RepID=A0A251SE57_HELAN|nr:putative pectinesterase [Helianthus annuus]KAJ0457060.1 putative pectinesterase [Helianthus annuus]KAJ0474143.1 putative pectinesterase [Helianthus annuus]KAJ0649712.1 putative pectinesterase [Helianthus annuus]